MSRERYEYRTVTKAGEEPADDTGYTVRWTNRRDAEQDRRECDKWSPWDAPHRVQRRLVPKWEDVR